MYPHLLQVIWVVADCMVKGCEAVAEVIDAS